MGDPNRKLQDALDTAQSTDKASTLGWTTRKSEDKAIPQQWQSILNAVSGYDAANELRMIADNQELPNGIDSHQAGGTATHGGKTRSAPMPQTSSRNKNHSDTIQDNSLHGDGIVIRALQSADLMPDVRQNKILDEADVISAVKYNKRRKQAIQSHIVQISKAANYPRPITEEEQAQTIAHAQNNLGMPKEDVDGKFGTKTLEKLNKATGNAQKTEKNNKPKNSIAKSQDSQEPKIKNTASSKSTKPIPQINYAAAIKWNDEHFKTQTDSNGTKTWLTLAKAFNIDLADDSNITFDEKKNIVTALIRQQQVWNTSDKSIDIDGLYGIKCIKLIESKQNFIESDTESNFNKRQQNIEKFVQIDASKPEYSKRHARYLTEFMTLSDKFKTAADKKDQNISRPDNGEQVPYDLVRRMILDDLCNDRHDNIGLLSLWIGTAEWGVSDVPDSIEDPAKSRWIGPKITGGKRSREYEQGGVGIADYDVGPLLRFYEKFGMPDGLSKDDSKYVTKTKNKKTQKITYSAKAFDKIKSNHEWYEYISKLFDRGDGSKAGDEWNDEASIWIMEDWLATNWTKSIDVMKDDGKAAVYSRMKNSASVVVEGQTNFPCDTGTMDFQEITNSWKIGDMEDQYGDYGVCKHKNGHSDEKARNNYKSRLQTAKRIETLKDHVKSTYKAQGCTISADGAHVLDSNGNVIN